MLDLGPKFETEADHLATLLEERDRIIAGRVALGIPYLDDCLGGIFPRDLLLVGAGTGVGKTELAVLIAMAAVSRGVDVFGFFLEAEVGEVSARLWFAELCKRVNNKNLDFGGWWRGQWKHLDAKYSDEIRAALAPRLAKLRTLYKKRGDFSVHTLNQQLEAIQSQAGMVILDHIHMVGDDDQARTVQTLRDMALSANIPVVAISHVRKKQTGRTGALLPETDDLHGDSTLSKVGTQIVLIGRDWHGPRPAPHLSPTLIQVPKDRKGRSTPYVARVMYDLSRGRYEQGYELGELTWEKRKELWQLMPEDQLPHWAQREARQLTKDSPI